MARDKSFANYSNKNEMNVPQIQEKSPQIKEDGNIKVEESKMPISNQDYVSVKVSYFY